MRIAIVGPYYVPQMFGIEKIMQAHARELVMRGHEVCVFTSNLRYPSGTYDLPEDETFEGAKVLRLRVSLRRPPMPFTYPSNGGFLIPGLRAALEAFQPDIVHAHNIGAAAWAHTAGAVAKSTGSPFFYSTYHHPSKLKLDWIRKIILRGLNRQPLLGASKIYHLTRSDFDKLLVDYPFAPQDRFSVLPGGVGPSRGDAEFAHDTRGNTLLFVGRVDDARKGFAILEEAMVRLIANAAFNYRLVVVGTILAETRARLEEKFGLRIEVCGVVDELELERQYAQAGIFVMPSYYEGFGMPFIEAMRYGLPVIGTTVGGVPEVVPPGTGLLVAPGDVSALMRAIMMLINDIGSRSSLAAAGREWARHFYWETIVNQLETDYSTALSQVEGGHEGMSQLGL